MLELCEHFLLQRNDAKKMLSVTMLAPAFWSLGYKSESGGGGGGTFQHCYPQIVANSRYSLKEDSYQPLAPSKGSASQKCVCSLVTCTSVTNSSIQFKHNSNCKWQKYIQTHPECCNVLGQTPKVVMVTLLCSNMVSMSITAYCSYTKLIKKIRSYRAD